MTISQVTTASVPNAIKALVNLSTSEEVIRRFASYLACELADLGKDHVYADELVRAAHIAVNGGFIYAKQERIKEEMPYLLAKVFENEQEFLRDVGRVLKETAAHEEA